MGAGSLWGQQHGVLSLIGVDIRRRYSAIFCHCIKCGESRRHLIACKLLAVIAASRCVTLVTELCVRPLACVCVPLSNFCLLTPTVCN